jgi:hypothetical protein
MLNSILESPLLRTSKPWWHPFLSLSITLYGILVLGWNLQPIVILFWFEIIFMAAAALIRGFFALDGKPFFNNFLQKLFFLVGGTFMFAILIMLAVTFSFKVFDGGMKSEGFDTIPTQIRILLVGYLIGLAIHFFANGRYKTATLMGELVQTFVHIWVLLALLMVLTMHLIPAYPQLDQAKWVGLSVVLVKFIVDLGFARVQKPFREVLSGADLPDANRPT